MDSKTGSAVPKVSLVIPTFRREQMLLESIASALAQGDIVRGRRPDPVPTADRLVQVLVHHRARRDHDVDDAPIDQVPEHLAESGRDERTGESEEDGGPFPVGERVLPDLQCATEISGLDRRRLELGEEVADPLSPSDVDRNDRPFQDLAPASCDGAGHVRATPLL